MDSTALQMATRNLNNAYEKFFRGEAKFPKFKKKKKSKNSFTVNYVNANIKVWRNKVQLPKLGWVKAKTHRPLEGRIISATVSKSATGKYYLSTTVNKKIKPLPQAEEILGIDLGILHYAISSDGQKIQGPRTLRRHLTTLKREQRKLSRRVKFSNNWYKQKRRVARVHEKIHNIRNEFLHKLALRIVRDNQVVILEDLSVKNMIKNNKLAKDIADAAWGRFYQFLEYKARWHGRIVHKINKWFASSKTCYHCSYIKEELSLETRTWDCPNCEAKDIDRDINAAKNILRKGLQELQELGVLKET